MSDATDMYRFIGNHLRIFLSYSHEDEGHVAQLETHLSSLARGGEVTEIWSNRMLAAGTDVSDETLQRMDQADLVLLLISPDYIAARQTYEIEMKRAMMRHTAGIARVVPVLLRATAYASLPFSHLPHLPSNSVPVTSWANRDEAWSDVIHGIQRFIHGQEARLAFITGLAQMPRHLEIVRLRQVGPEIDVLVRNITDNAVVIHFLQVTDSIPPSCLASGMAPTATYSLWPDGTADVAHVVPAHEADRFMLSLPDADSFRCVSAGKLYLRVALYYNQNHVTWAQVEVDVPYPQIEPLRESSVRRSTYAAMRTTRRARRR